MKTKISPLHSVHTRTATHVVVQKTKTRTLREHLAEYESKHGIRVVNDRPELFDDDVSHVDSGGVQ